MCIRDRPWGVLRYSSSAGSEATVVVIRPPFACPLPTLAAESGQPKRSAPEVCGGRAACVIGAYSWPSMQAREVVAARSAPAGAPDCDRGAAGVRDTPYDRALSAPRSRRQARDERSATNFRAAASHPHELPVATTLAAPRQAGWRRSSVSREFHRVGQPRNYLLGREAHRRCLR